MVGLGSEVWSPLVGKLPERVEQGPKSDIRTICFGQNRKGRKSFLLELTK